MKNYVTVNDSFQCLYIVQHLLDNTDEISVRIKTCLDGISYTITTTYKAANYLNILTKKVKEL